MFIGRGLNPVNINLDLGFIDLVGDFNIFTPSILPVFLSIDIIFAPAFFNSVIFLSPASPPNIAFSGAVKILALDSLSILFESASISNGTNDRLDFGIESLFLPSTVFLVSLLESLAFLLGRGVREASSDITSQLLLAF